MVEKTIPISTQTAIKRRLKSGFKVRTIAQEFSLTIQQVKQFCNPRYTNRCRSPESRFREAARMKGKRMMLEAMEITDESERDRKKRLIAANFLDVCPEWKELI